MDLLMPKKLDENTLKISCGPAVKKMVKAKAVYMVLISLPTLTRRRGLLHRVNDVYWYL